METNSRRWNEDIFSIKFVDGNHSKPCYSSLQGSVLNSVMSTNRFQSILQFLHFANNADYDAADPKWDRLHKIHTAVEYLVNNYQAVYNPDQNISIDEDLLLWKGKLSLTVLYQVNGQALGLNRLVYAKKVDICGIHMFTWRRMVPSQMKRSSLKHN